MLQLIRRVKIVLFKINAELLKMNLQDIIPVRVSKKSEKRKKI